MTAWGYEFYLLVLKVFLTRSLRLVVILSSREDKIRIPARPCNILSIFFSPGNRTVIFLFFFFSWILE